MDFDKADSQVLFLPLSYSFGLLGQILPALSLGKTTHYIDNIIKVGSVLNKSKIEMISGVPSQHHVLTKILKETENITHVISAGAPLSNELRSTMIKKYSNAIIYNNYGQTELSPRALISKSTEEGFLEGSTGKPVDGLTCKITTEGELLFKGKQVMLGYVKDVPEKIVDEWLYTGDLAVEKDGMIYVKGRLDSLVKVAGQRISLKFLENIIEELESVDYSGVIARDNSLYGNEIFVFFSGNNSEEKVLEQFKLKSGLKVIPKKIFKLEEFPMSTNGKKDYKSLNNLI